MNRLLFICLFFPAFFFAQIEEEARDSISDRYLIIEGDSILRTAIDLDEVMLLHKLEFSSKEDRRQYLILKRKTIKVYPYAKLAAERLETLNSRLDNMKTKRQRRKYAKRINKYIEGEFSDELKKLTRTEGQILIKLIHRQTGKTAFGLIKELRSGWRAFWYNNTAKIFDISLKREFDPLNVKEDYLIEDVLQRSFQNGRLPSQKSALDHDFFELTEKWIGDTAKTASNETANRN
ncbi:MAG: DUF4294 domain-containing protein [Flavobacteriaceae bacterium]|nr:DUF4294 domain-containing protein [Flavobacteriaceae bacterium]